MKMMKKTNKIQKRICNSNKLNIFNNNTKKLKITFRMILIMIMNLKILGKIILYKHHICN